MKRCPFCAEEIQDAAIVCKHCGRDLASGPSPQTVAASERAPSSGAAAVLSLVIPGAGQIYKGQVGAGLMWLVFTVLGYALLILPGLILHIVCIVNAASRPTIPTMNRAQTNYSARSSAEVLERPPGSS